MEKKIIFRMLMKPNVWLLVMCMAVLSSCKKDPELTVSTNQISFSADGESVNLKVKSNTDWIITGNPSWLTVSPSTGSENANVLVSAQQNSETTPRKCTLTISTDDAEVIQTINVEQEGMVGILKLSASEVSLEAAGGSEATFNITSNTDWSVSVADDSWLNVSPKSGYGNSVIKVTAKSENWSDEKRSVALTFDIEGKSVQATINQDPSLPANLRVSLSNMTLMSDGFACDLTFGSDAKGYKEAFFLKEEVETMTDRDIFNKLMENEEYSEKTDYTYLPGWVDPETELVYCIAAYGNDNNSDGTHKYGPITIEYITTPSKTIEADMYLSSTYNSSRWTVTADRAGSYGQRCDEFYYYAAEGDIAWILNYFADNCTYACLAHLFFKPMIAEDENDGYLYGPQTLTFTRTGDEFFCITWGIHRDTKQFSSELSNWIYWDLTSDYSAKPKRMKSNSSDWNKPHSWQTKSEIAEVRNSIKAYKAIK